MTKPVGYESVKFWDRQAESYSKRPVADEASYQTKLAVTQGYFRPDMNVLEFGCGTGSTAIVHAPHVKQILAIDVSTKMLDIAQRKADAAEVQNLRFEQSSIDEFEAPDAHFDAVLGLSIMHLVRDKDAVAAKVYRMLKPGGFFATSTVCIEKFAWLFDVVIPIGHFLGLLPFVKPFSAIDLERTLLGAGFVIDHQWLPGKGKSVFIVAKKPGGSTSR
jgi:ubiquinone/menaquinone biosynthesis C-methylase UbiE